MSARQTRKIAERLAAVERALSTGTVTLSMVDGTSLRMSGQQFLAAFRDAVHGRANPRLDRLARATPDDQDSMIARALVQIAHSNTDPQEPQS
ncbi:hypothetical protein [Saccharopolyspora cebuensis]|uniref:hypothetical protein n=1 Tax=Saccharopolyspora cebuensis TaxID=418759 RepID=UPI0031EDB95E